MYVQRYSVAITGSTAAAATAAYSPVLNGRLLSVRYSSGGTISSTAVLTLTNEGTDEAYYAKAIGSAGASFRPRGAICKTTGTGIYQTTGTANPIVDYLELANERLKCTVSKSTASGLTGTLLIAVG